MRRYGILLVVLVTTVAAACGGEGDSWSSTDSGDLDVVDAGEVSPADTSDTVPPDTRDTAPGDTSDTSDTTPVTHDEALERLGAVIDLGPRLDPDEHAVRDGYNPFGDGRRTLHDRVEMYVAGLSPIAGKRQALYDDSDVNPPDVLFTEDADDAWAVLPKAAACGDVDGDARDEVVVAILNNDAGSAQHGRLFLRIIEDAEDEYAVDEVEIATFTELDFSGGWDWLEIDAATGDLDGDLRDEIIVTAFGELWVIDDRSGGYGFLHSQTFAKSGTVEQYLRVAAGDTDADGMEEMIVVDGQIAGANGTATWYLYNQAFGVEDSGPVQVSIDAVPHVLATADPAVGDVDGDGMNEVVFAGRQTGVAIAQVLVMDDARAEYAFLPVHYGWGWSAPLAMTETGDFDGDGIAEIVAYRNVLDDVLEASDGLLVRQSWMQNEVYYGAFAVGDVTNDLRDDIIYVTGGDAWLTTWGTNSAGVYHQALALNLIGGGNYPVVAAPNVDGDSAIVEFEDHELLFTEPVLLAVLAAPPSHAAVSTDLDGAGTSFGRASGTGVETERSLGFSAGFTVGTEFEDRLFSQSKARFTVTVETSMDWTATTSREVEKAYTYNGTGATDKVVFATVPYDVYYYRVISSPVAEEVGSTMVVNLPREPQVLFVDRDFFNANNGDFQDVDERVLTHEVGVPSSYPTSASFDWSELVAQGGAYSDPMTVGQGPGSQTLEITISEGTGHGTSFDLSVTVEAEVGSGGFVFGTSRGFHYGYGYRISSTESTLYSGTVGNILDPIDWVEHQFDFGLYVRPMNLAGQRFPLIGYWVD